MYTCVAWSLIHSQLSMTLTKRSGSRLISGSSDLTWEGVSESNSWRQVESEYCDISISSQLYCRDKLFGAKTHNDQTSIVEHLLPDLQRSL